MVLPIILLSHPLQVPASTSSPQMLLSSPPAQQSLAIWDIQFHPTIRRKVGKKYLNTLWLGSIFLFFVLLFANSEHFHAWRLGQAMQLHGLESMRHVPCWQIRKSNLRGCAEVRFRGCTEVELRQPWNEMWRDQRTKGKLHTNSDAHYMTQPCVVQAMDFWWFLPIFALNGGMSISMSLTPTKDPKIHQRTCACRVIAWRTSQNRNVCFESESVSGGESRAPSWYLLSKGFFLWSSNFNDPNHGIISDKALAGPQPATLFLRAPRGVSPRGSGELGQPWKNSKNDGNSLKIVWCFFQLHVNSCSPPQAPKV